MILAVLLIYLAAGGHVQVVLDPPKMAGTVEECRAQLQEIYERAAFDLIESQLGPIERVVGECRAVGDPA